MTSSTAGYIVICQGLAMKLCRGRGLPAKGILLFGSTATLFDTRREVRQAIDRSKKYDPDHTLHTEETHIVRVVGGGGWERAGVLVQRRVARRGSR